MATSVQIQTAVTAAAPLDVGIGAGVSVAASPILGAVLAIVEVGSAIGVAFINKALAENLAKRAAFYRTYLAARAAESMARMSERERILWATIVPVGVGMGVLLLIGRALVG